MAPSPDSITESHTRHGLWSGLAHMLEGSKKRNVQKRREGREGVVGGRGEDRGWGEEGRTGEERGGQGRKEGSKGGGGEGQEWRREGGKQGGMSSSLCGLQPFLLFY